ncbi:MAG: DUF805 domain-containing protein [Deltaproteobacteria bacterium]
MSFIEAIKSGYRNYITFSGRSQRSAYWWWVLFQIIVAVIIGAIEGGGTMASGDGGFSANYTGGPIANIWGMANFLPGLAVSVRRLHDTDRSGWWILLWLIPLVGWIILIVWFATKGTSGTNRFGADPFQNRAEVF